MSDTAHVATERPEVNIPVIVYVSLDGSGLGSVEGALDMRTGESIGDIGVYEFDVLADFTGRVKRGVLSVLDECGTFAPGVFYSVDIQINDGGSEIGSASSYFYGPYTDDEDG